MNSIGISDCPDYLIVLRILRDGTFEEVYNGPGAPAWNAAGKVQKTSQRRVSLSKLHVLNELVTESERVSRVS